MIVRIMALVAFALGAWMTLATGFGAADPARGGIAIAGSILVAAGLFAFALDERLNKE